MKKVQMISLCILLKASNSGGLNYALGLPRWQPVVKNTPANAGDAKEMWVWSLSWEDPWRRKCQPTPVSLPGKSHGQRSLAGYSPWNHWESDMTEQWSTPWVRHNVCLTSQVLEHVVHESDSHSVLSDSLQPHGLYSPWNSLGQNTRVGSLSLPERIFPTKGSNPGLPHCR